MKISAKNSPVVIRIIRWIFVILAVVAIALGYKLYHDLFYLQSHCTNIANAEMKTHPEWKNKLVPAPNWAPSQGLIYMEYEKELECENNNKAFIFF